MTPLLRVSNLQVYFPIKRGLLKRTVGQVHAVENVSFTVEQGEVFSLVGESGCGKSTTGNAVLQLLRPTGGQVFFQNTDLCKLSENEMREKRRLMQMVFQNPYSSLNPRMNVRQLLEEPLQVHFNLSRQQRRERVEQMMEKVGLAKEYLERYPHQFSGGQKQRVGIARALITKPSFIMADEPVSALDVSIQAQILNLLIDIQKETNVAMVFISHNLHVVRHISDRLGVMYLGQLMEVGGTKAVFEHPLHPYTLALLEAAPKLDPDQKKTRLLLEGDVPNPASPPSGCPFHPRCARSMPCCRDEKPQLREAEPGHLVACHLHA